MRVHYVEVGDLTVDATPNFYVNENGERCLEWAANGTTIHDMVLLFDAEGRPINAANEYLIYCKTVDKLQDIRSIAKGLMHFFDFLDTEKLSWDKMPRPRNQRPLYRFREYLQALHDEIDPETGKRRLASTTAKSYRGAAIGLYVYWQGYGKFERDPCHIFEANISDYRKLGHINRNIKVQMTDLKIDARDKSKNTVLPNHLSPLLMETRPELQALKSIIKNGYGYVQVNGKYIKKSISSETKLAVLLALYTGMRRLEILSFSSSLIYMPRPDENAIPITIGPAIRCHTKGGESGEIKIPSWLMRLLFQYIHSRSYKNRLAKFIERTRDPLALKYPPLLLSSQGKPYSGNSLNARWSEIRNAIIIDQNLPKFAHKFHNLRSTYATYLTFSLLNLKFPENHPSHPNEPVLTRSQVEAEVQARMRHSSPQTTALYVKFWDEYHLEREADRIYQEELDNIYGDDEAIGMWNDTVFMKAGLKGEACPK